MTPFFRRFFCLTAILLSLAAFAGCGKEETPVQAQTVTTAPSAEPTADPKELVEHLQIVLDAGELYTLNQYPNLKTADLSGSTCYDAILQFLETKPPYTITYSVDLGGTQVSSTAESATLTPGTFTHEALMENLQYLPSLTSISLPEMDMDAQQVTLLRETYPELRLDYTVELFGSTYGLDTTSLDLSAMDSSKLDEAAKKLGLLPNLQNVTLSDSLTIEEVAKIQDSNKNAIFAYNFTLFGKTLSTTMETVEYKNQSIGNEGEEELRKALGILRSCKRFVLDNCGFDYEVLAAVREDFREQTSLVWRVYFGVDKRYNTLTDAEMIRAVYNVTDDNVSPLKYCEGAKYIDMGHNEYLTDFTFVSGMPNLEAFIGSGSAVTELTGFENCKNLYWLEMANCYKLKNIDALAGCEKLGYLNISYSKVTSYMALDGLPLERFIAMNPRASTNEQNTFVAIHEGCRTVFYGYSNPFTPWRYDDNGKTFNKYYKEVIREVFDLDRLESYLPKENKK